MKVGNDCIDIAWVLDKNVYNWDQKRSQSKMSDQTDEKGPHTVSGMQPLS